MNEKNEIVLLLTRSITGGFVFIVDDSNIDFRLDRASTVGVCLRVMIIGSFSGFSFETD